MRTKFVTEHIAITQHKGSGALATFKNTTERKDGSVTSVKVDVKDKQAFVASWGPNNDDPQQIIKQVKRNGSASSGLRFLRKTHYGNGIILYKDNFTDGKKAVDLVSLDDYPEIKEFFRKNQIKRFAKETILDLEWWSIAFPEYILSENYQTVNRTKRHKTPWCRFGLMDETSGLVEYVYISEKFGKESVSKTSEYVEEVPLIDSYWSPDEVREYCKANKIHKFIRPIFYPLVDEAYYPDSEWHAVSKSGWLDVANSVPELKKALFEKQMTIKYIIEIDERYFEHIYNTQWKQFKPEERIEIRQNLIDALEEGLVGNKNAGKTIQSMMFPDSQGNQTSAVKIETIDDKLKDGSYLPEAEAANSEVLFALGVDPSLIGAGIPGGKLGAGSGSDKREAFTILSALMKTNRETTLEAFEFIQEYNGWDDTLKFGFENTILTTLDKNPTGSQTTTA